MLINDNSHYEATLRRSSRWVRTAIDADTKLVMSCLVGGRDSEYAMAFIDDLSRRLANRVQLTSDRAYLEAVEALSVATLTTPCWSRSTARRRIAPRAVTAL